jgi:hypothetical protein
MMASLSLDLAAAARDLRIWIYAFGYFACYAPYSALTKLVSQGRLPGMARPLDGFEMLPLTTFSSLVGMAVFLTAKGWWRHAGQREIAGVRVPVPGFWTLLSGVATAAIIATTTLAYTFEGTSIVFMMLLMRGGVLVLAPIVDAVSKRRVQWTSWIALGLSLAALFVALADGASYELSLLAGIDVLVYLAGYFVRLRFMSRLAKSSDPRDSVRYFVEEQMVATPAIVLLLVVLALVGHGPIMLSVRAGFTSIWESGAVAASVLIGLLSQGTGITGALILLEPQENAFCVPVNRASSILAGVVASGSLVWLGFARKVAGSELAGAGLVVAAIAALASPTLRRALKGRSRGADRGS